MEEGREGKVKKIHNLFKCADCTTCQHKNTIQYNIYIYMYIIQKNLPCMAKICASRMEVLDLISDDGS